MENNDIHAIILAAGRGTRMKCDSPKCLTMLGDKPFLERVLSATKPLCDKPTVVVGFKGEEVVEAIGVERVNFVWQHEQLGTGHAVGVTKELLADNGYKHIVVLMGDQPLITSATLTELVQVHKDRGATVTVTSAIVPNFENEFAPFLRFGRVIRNEHNLVDAIVEYKDATAEIQAHTEVNIGTYVFDAAFLWSHIDTISDNNASSEYYLTDLVHMAFAENKKVVPYVLPEISEAFGVNSLEDLEIAKRFI